MYCILFYPPEASHSVIVYWWSYSSIVDHCCWTHVMIIGIRMTNRPHRMKVYHT